ncbi:hypothetical protein Pmar_PMAR015600, partial [Perkinsus marinus ATCC 50983]
MQSATKPIRDMKRNDDLVGVEVTAKHIFGFNSRVRNHPIFVDEVTVAYAAAHYVIIHNTETNTQKLLPNHSGSIGVTCLALCPENRYLAVAESFLVNRQQESNSLITVAVTPTPTTTAMGTWIANWCLDKVPVGASRLLAWSKIAAPVAAANKRMSIRGLSAEGSVVAGTRFPSVIVWNYEDRKCEIHEKFDEEVCCVAIHPNGFGMIVALAGRIRLMNLLMDAIQPYKDLPVRNSREVKYAHGGHLFAVAGSANQVQ